jgi:hypothetical protein
VFSNFSFRISYRLWDNVGKYGRGIVTTGDSMIWRMHIACWITNATNTHPVCNTYCCSTTTMGVRTRLNATLYAYCLSSLCPNWSHRVVCPLIVWQILILCSLLYQGNSKIFRTDTVKLINLTTKHMWKLPTSTQLRATWHTAWLYMVVLLSTGGSRYHICCIDGNTSPEYCGYSFVCPNPYCQLDVVLSPIAFGS